MNAKGAFRLLGRSPREEPEIRMEPVGGISFELSIIKEPRRSAVAKIDYVGRRMEIKLPRGISKAYSNSLASTFISRLEKRLSSEGIESLEERQMMRRSRILFRNGQELSIMGQRFVIDAKRSRRRLSSARIEGDKVVIELGEGLSVEEEENHISCLSRKAISMQMLPLLRNRVEELNSLSFGFRFNSVSLKSQSSRWGSCSAKGNINLNFKLLFAPKEIMDYVILHELAHIKEHNHSKAFWKLVESAMSDYKERSRWLRENGDKIIKAAGLNNHTQQSSVQ